MQHVPRLVAVDPLAERLETDVCRIVGLVVHTERRRMSEQHFGGRQTAHEQRRLLLRVLMHA
jgi:hypothetical protein